MNRYGIRWMRTWPHISLGVSAHIDRKFGHLSLHLPVGVIVVGFIGADSCIARSDDGWGISLAPMTRVPVG